MELDNLQIGKIEWPRGYPFLIASVEIAFLNADGQTRNIINVKVRCPASSSESLGDLQDRLLQEALATLKAGVEALSETSVASLQEHLRARDAAREKERDDRYKSDMAKIWNTNADGGTF